ncbi:MAG: LemA family protein [Magnetococcales bacterium]|nr:LemA family protein [Magnetococcales bacterium]
MAANLDDLDQEPLSDERMRRMKSLMRQLYKEEFESKRVRLPPVKGSGIIVLVSVVTICLFAATTLYNYNHFVTLYQEVLATRGHVEASVQRRSNLFNTLVNLTLNHAELEREVFRHVANARQEFKTGEPVGGGEGRSAMPVDEPVAGLARLMAVVEKYPDIKASTTYKELMSGLLAIENDILKRRAVANEAIRVFNTVVTTFPWQYLAQLTGFDHVDYYHSEHHKEDDLLLTTNSFNRLLPPGMPGAQPVNPSRGR